MTKKEMQLELWKAMHGMVIPMPFLKDIPEADMKSFREIYDNPKKNRQLAENRFENAPLLEKVRKETALCILEYASRGLFEELGALAVVFYYGSAGTRALPKQKICWQFWLGETIRMRCIALSVCWRLILKALTTAVCQCLKGFFTGIKRDWKPVERDGLKNAAAVIEKRSD